MGKRILSVIITILITMGIPVCAVQPENPSSTGDIDPEVQAVMLQKLGLLKGTDKGFELERNMTRAEAAVMFVRFLGAEKIVLAGTWKHPFRDVPKWADPYVGWLYQSGLTKGVGKTEYGAKKNTTMEQYAVFLSRAVSGNDLWQQNGIATADEVRLCDDTNHLFTRAAAVGLTSRALSVTYTKNGNYTYSMAQYLINHGVFTSGQLHNAAWGVIAPAYLYLDDKDYLYNTIAGVAVAKTDIEGIRFYTGAESRQPYFFAAVSSGNALSLYKINRKTMDDTLVSHKIISGDANNWYYTYLDSVGGKDYLLEASYPDACVNLIACESDQVRVVLSGLDTSFTNYFVGKDSVVLAGNDHYYCIGGNGVVGRDYPKGTQVVDYQGTSMITQRTDTEKTTISCVNASDGEVLDEFTVKQDSEENRRTVSRRESKQTSDESGKYYGEAGLYVLGRETGRLAQRTDRPVLDIRTLRNDDRYLILTHEPGERVWGMNDLGGNEIVRLEPDGSETVLLGNNPTHNLDIAGFGADDGISFYTASGVGMQHFNVFTYMLIPSADSRLPHIEVIGYEAGRPEMEAEGYAPKAVAAEQARLDSLGY